MTAIPVSVWMEKSPVLRYSWAVLWVTPFSALSPVDSHQYSSSPRSGVALGLVSCTAKAPASALLATPVSLWRTTTASPTRVLPWASAGPPTSSLWGPNATPIPTTRTTVPTSPSPLTKKWWPRWVTAARWAVAHIDSLPRAWNDVFHREKCSKSWHCLIIKENKKQRRINTALQPKCFCD